MFKLDSQHARPTSARVHAEVRRQGAVVLCQKGFDSVKCLFCFGLGLGFSLLSTISNDTYESQLLSTKAYEHKTCEHMTYEHMTYEHKT